MLYPRMVSFFWSQSKRRAVDDEKAFWANEWEDYKREVHKANEPMLAHELQYYRGTFYTINLAKQSSSQMKLSGGKEWVAWMEKRANLELEYVIEELNKRGILDRYKGFSGKGDFCLPHSWDIIRFCERYEKNPDDRLTDLYNQYRSLREQVGF
jgi:hypothetical protein